METKKTIVVAVIIIILMITIGVYVVIMAKKGMIETKPTPVSQQKITNQLPESNSKIQPPTPKTETDSDVTAMESDLNSINDADFSENGLSDQELGL
jgi:flagellar basal body-associated protein FliL